MDFRRTFTRWRARSGLALSIAVSILALSVEARADGSAVSNSSEHFQYRGAPGCPSEAEFLALLTANVHRALATDAPDILRVEASVAADGSGGTAHVLYVDGAGHTVTRALTAATCAEAVSAAALVAALAIDARPDATPPDEPPASTPAPATPAPAPPDRDTAAPAPPAANSSPVWSAGAGFWSEWFVLPAPTLGGAVLAGLAAPDDRWSVRAGVVFAQTGTVTKGDRAASFRLVAGRAEGCALPLLRSRYFLLGPCATAEVGDLASDGVGTATSSPDQEHGIWAAVGPMLRLQAAVAALRVELLAGPWFPLMWSHQFVFDRADGTPDKFHTVPLVGAAGALTVAYRF